MSDVGLVYACGRIEVDQPRRELRVRGAPAALGERAFEILCVLVASAGELVTKDELMRRVWPGALVEENTLEVHLSALRKALGPDRVLLKTAYGRGYRLLGTWTATRRERPADSAVPGAAPRPPRSNLPVAGSGLIGRAAAVGHLCDLLSAHRAVTLTGVGGIGKTRLAVEVAHSLSAHFGGDIWFVELAALSDPALVPSAVARVLGLRLGGDEHSADAVARAIAQQRTLLILDNCEHLMDAAAGLAEAVLRLCPRATLLATSREVLRVDGEQVYRVGSLDVPLPGQDNPGGLLACSAAELFVARAQALGAAPPAGAEDARAIATICRRLDGIPLAIEFAASRAATIGVGQVAAGLADRFSLLTVGRRTALPRHRTLRAVLDWSHDLLPEDEAMVLRCLSVFAGEFPLDAAQAVVGDLPGPQVVECIGSLVSKSLVAADLRDGIPYYHLLETVRLYALEKLRGSGGHAAVARRHAEHYRALSARADADHGVRPEAEWLALHGRHLDNWRAALDWAFSAEGDAATGVALTVGALPLWLMLSSMTECRARVEQALAVARDAADARAVMRLSAARAVALFYTEKGAGAEVAAAWTQVLDLADRLDDTDYRLWARWGLWNHQLNHGACRAALLSAQRFCELAVSPSDLATGERMVGVSLHFLGEQEAARRHLHGVLTRVVEAPARSMIRAQYDQRLAARCYLPRILWLQGQPDAAMRAAHDVVRDARESGHALAFALALVQAGCPVALLTGDLAAAEGFVAALLEKATTHGLGFWGAEGRCYAGILRVTQGDVAAGVGAFRAAVQTLLSFGTSMNITGYLAGMAAALAGTAHDNAAAAAGAAMVDEAIGRATRDEEAWCMPELLRLRGEFRLATSVPEAAAAAEADFDAALGLARRQGALAWELRAATSLARLMRSQGRAVEARSALAPVHGRFAEGLGTGDLLRARQMLDAVS